jgi:cell division transport system permease protein
MRAWLTQHGRAALGTCARLARSPVTTLLNVIVVGIALALPAGLYIGLVNVQKAVRTVSPEPQLTIFLALDATRADASAVDTRLKQHPQVAHMRYVPRERALEDLKRSTGMGGVAEALDRNPLPDAFVVDSSDGSAEAMERLRTELAALPKVAHVQLDAEWAQRLDAALRLGRAALMLLGTILAFALVAITFNTIRLQILTQREEIEVTTLIGATDAFVRRPFLYYGAALGLLGGLAAWGFVWAATAVLNDALVDLSYLYGARWELGQLGLRDSLSLLGFAALLGWFGAWMSVGRHLANARPH